jgi:hypothetical protein
MCLVGALIDAGDAVSETREESVMSKWRVLVMTGDSKYWHCSRSGRVHQLGPAFPAVHIMNLHSFVVAMGLVYLCGPFKLSRSGMALGLLRR